MNTLAWKQNRERRYGIEVGATLLTSETSKSIKARDIQSGYGTIKDHDKDDDLDLGDLSTPIVIDFNKTKR